jgi:hypothetical protein
MTKMKITEKMGGVFKLFDEIFNLIRIPFEL